MTRPLFMLQIYLVLTKNELILLAKTAHALVDHSSKIILTVHISDQVHNLLRPFYVSEVTTEVFKGERVNLEGRDLCQTDFSSLSTGVYSDRSKFFSVRVDLFFRTARCIGKTNRKSKRLSPPVKMAQNLPSIHRSP